jgi:hypothetical protein
LRDRLKARNWEMSLSGSGRATVMTARWGTYGGSPALLGDKR